MLENALSSVIFRFTFRMLGSKMKGLAFEVSLKHSFQCRMQHQAFRRELKARETLSTK